MNIEYAFVHRVAPRWTTIITGLVTVSILVCSVACRESSSGKMATMMERARKQFTPVQLQKAVATVCEQYETDTMVPVDSLPPEILSLSSESPGYAAMAGTADNGKGTLDVFWGGAFGGYGVLVCPVGGHLNTNRIVRRFVPWSQGVAFYVQ